MPSTKVHLKANKFFKRSSLIIIIPTLLYLLFISILIISLLTKTFITNKSDLKTLENVKMLSRAYLTGGGKSSSKYYEFKDQHYRKFLISGSRYNAITNRAELYDSLQYSGLIMTILTTAKGFNDYHDDKNNNEIEIYGIRIGKKEYINLEKINLEERKNRYSIIIFISIVYLIFIVIHFTKLKYMFPNSRDLSTP